MMSRHALTVFMAVLSTAWGVFGVATLSICMIKVVAFIVLFFWVHGCCSLLTVVIPVLSVTHSDR